MTNLGYFKAIALSFLRCLEHTVMVKSGWAQAMSRLPDQNRCLHSLGPGKNVFVALVWCFCIQSQHSWTKCIVTEEWRKLYALFQCKPISIPVLFKNSVKCGLKVQCCILLSEEICVNVGSLLWDGYVQCSSQGTHTHQLAHPCHNKHPEQHLPFYTMYPK